MTREEKMNAIDDLCNGTDCVLCPIYGFDYCKVDDFDWSDEMIDKAYALMANPELDEAHKRFMNIREDDKVNHPNHYCKGGIECIAAIKASMTSDGFCDYCKGNIIKYLWRWRDKGGVQDLDKAKVYLDWLIEAAKGETN